MMVDWMVQVDGIGERNETSGTDESNGMDRMVDRMVDRINWMI